MFIKHYSGKHCWIPTDVLTLVDYLPNAAPFPLQEIVISSLRFLFVVRNMSNDNIIEYATVFALTVLRECIPRGSVHL